MATGLGILPSGKSAAAISLRASSTVYVLSPQHISVTTILFFVRVPVLSEQMTETDPSVSTVFSDLQRILFLRIMLATIVKLVVSAMGRPSGMTGSRMSVYVQRVQALDTHTSNSGRNAAHDKLRYVDPIRMRFPQPCRPEKCEYRSAQLSANHTYQSTMMRITTQNIKAEMMRMKRRISFWSGVISVLGSEVSFAIRPKMVLSPVETQTPMQLPETQCVPCIPMLFVSR